MYEASIICSPTLTYLPTSEEQQVHIIPQQHTSIVDLGETRLYIAPSAPHSPTDTRASTTSVGKSNGQVEK